MCFFFKQKTAYEMRISDWSSDVCSSDLLAGDIRGFDPGFFAPDFPGTLSADLASSGSIDDGGVQLRADLATLRGRVRGRVVSGSARLDQRAGQIGRASCRERVCKYE